MTPQRRKSQPRGRSSEPLVFRGTPRRLSGVVPLATGAALAMVPGPVEADLGGVEIRRLRIRRPRGAAPATAHLRLAESTPPGRYEGLARVGDRDVSIVAEVQARSRLRASPPRLDLEGAPGAGLTATIEVVNVGNAPTEIPARSKIGLLSEGAFGRAFWRALTADPPAGKGRLEAMADALAEDAGGMIVVQVPRGGEPIKPAESRVLALMLQLPDELGSGRTYLGTWEPPGLMLPIRLSVTAGEAGPKPKRARK